MAWFFFTLIAPFLYAVTNHIDKVLLEKYFKHGGVGTLILTSSLLSALALPFLYLADPTLLQIEPVHVLALVLVGILNILVLWLYFLALKDDEASVVVVFYQLVPVFGYLLGYILLGEVLTLMQVIAMAIVIFGTTIISFEVDQENRFTVRKRTVGYMLAASFFWASESVVFKAVALEEEVVRTLFWEHLVLVLIGILIFLCVRSYRKHFLSAIRDNSTAIIGLNFTNEILFIVASVIFGFAYMMAPISLVLLANSYQPIFVLAIGVAMTLLFPTVVVEKVHARHLWQKGLAIAITGIGTYLLLVT